MITKQQAYLAALRSDFRVFLYQAFATAFPGQQFLDNWHIDAIVHALEDSLVGRSPRLIINLPPRHLKSCIVSTALPAFLLGCNPSARVICVSYSEELAKALARGFNRIVLSDWYRRVFAHVRLSKVTEAEVVTDQGGSRYATSVYGTLTGRGADFILIDDPSKPEEVLSDKARQAVNDWYRSTLVSRLDDKERSVLILVMQRLHVNDLTGFVEASGGFHKLVFPAIATRDEEIELRHGARHRRREGEALHGAREGLAVLRRLRDEVGSFNFESQYQQSPQVPDGELFKRQWFTLVDQVPDLHPDGQLYLSIDSAVSTSNTADYSALSLVYVRGKMFTVLHAERERWEYEELKAKALAYHRRHGERITFIVEAAGTGISLYQYLRREQISSHFYRPSKDKMTRACLALPMVAAGRVQILNRPGKNAWVEPYVNEFVNFPHGRYDDQVDSLVQLMLWADKRHNPQGSYYEVY